MVVNVTVDTPEIEDDAGIADCVVVPTTYGEVCFGLETRTGADRRYSDTLDAALTVVRYALQLARTNPHAGHPVDCPCPSCDLVRAVIELERVVGQRQPA